MNKYSEEQIQRMIDADPDAPEITDEQTKKARPFLEVFPALADKMKRLIGRPKSE